MSRTVAERRDGAGTAASVREIAAAGRRNRAALERQRWQADLRLLAAQSLPQQTNLGPTWTAVRPLAAFELGGPKADLVVALLAHMDEAADVRISRYALRRRDGQPFPALATGDKEADNLAALAIADLLAAGYCECVSVLPAPASAAVGLRLSLDVAPISELMRPLEGAGLDQGEGQP